jgi:hypothetical protein
MKLTTIRINHLAFWMEKPILLFGWKSLSCFLDGKAYLAFWMEKPILLF